MYSFADMEQIIGYSAIVKGEAVPNESTIKDLRAAIRQLETEKREIEERHRALVTTLRYFENPERVLEPQHQRTDNDLRNAISEILAQEGPLHRRDIHDRLVSMGVHIGGRDPVNNVGAHLSIDPRFRNVGRGMWNLSEPPSDTVTSERFGADTEADGMGDDHNASRDQDDSDEEDDIAW